jgi:hypothetical protein
MSNDAWLNSFRALIMSRAADLSNRVAVVEVFAITRHRVKVADGVLADEPAAPTAVTTA